MTLFTANTPTLKVKVRRNFLNLSLGGFEDAYLVGVTALASRPLLFHVHLKSGGFYSRLPITALLCTKYMGKNEESLTNLAHELTLHEAQPWSCLPGPIQVVEFSHFKDYRVKSKSWSGFYLFSVDYGGPGLAEDPEQWKMHHICVTENGNLRAVPNNDILFLDEYFTEEAGIPQYKRTKDYHFSRG